MASTAALAIPCLALLFACASEAEKRFEPVRIVTSGQKAAQCKTLGKFTVNQRGGQDKQAGALQKAIEEVSILGGNGLFIISRSADWEEGVALSGEALRCQF